MLYRGAHRQGVLAERASRLDSSGVEEGMIRPGRFPLLTTVGSNFWPALVISYSIIAWQAEEVKRQATVTSDAILFRK